MPTPVLTASIRWYLVLTGWIHHPPRRRCQGDRGQATTEYALILLGAALVGLLVVAWATGGGASGRIGQLFDRVVDSVMSRL